MSRVHSTTLVAMLKRVSSSLSDEDKITLNDHIASVPFTPDQRDNVQREILSSVPEVAQAARARRAMQDCRSFTAYSTEADWALFADAMQQKEATMHTLCSRLHQLGCSCPSERTLTLVVDFFCSLSAMRMLLEATSKKRLCGSSSNSTSTRRSQVTLAPGVLIISWHCLQTRTSSKS